MILTTGSLRSGDEFINVTVLVVHFSRRTQLLAGKLWLHESTWLRHSEVGMFGSRPQLATLKLDSPHIFKQVFGCLFELGSPQFHEVLATVFLQLECCSTTTSTKLDVEDIKRRPRQPWTQTSAQADRRETGRQARGMRCKSARGRWGLKITKD